MLAGLNSRFLAFSPIRDGIADRDRGPAGAPVGDRPGIGRRPPWPGGTPPSRGAPPDRGAQRAWLRYPGSR